jgi:hypothetical protein
LNLKYDFLVSKFAAFKFNLYRYAQGSNFRFKFVIGVQKEGQEDEPVVVVGLCTLNQVDP